MPNGLRIGARLRHAREGARMSLADVSGRAGVTKGFLSRVERDEASPSVASLVSICDAVGLSMSDLFATPRTTLVRAAERPSLGGLPKVDVHDTLITPELERQVTVLESVIPPGGSGGEALYTLPSECEVCFVLEGEIEVELEDGRYALGPGDALTFGAAVPHTFSSTAGARVLWILAPALPDPRKEAS
jgi:transcriptional regulator with XRE-family HTH domain